MMRAFLSLFFSLCLVLPAWGAQDEERILSFDSRISVDKDGSVDVTETIVVHKPDVAGNSDGLDRHFSNDSNEIYGRYDKVGFRIIEVLRDGRPEPYQLGFSKSYQSTIEASRNDAGVHIGDKTTRIRGETTYTLHYRLMREFDAPIPPGMVRSCRMGIPIECTFDSKQYDQIRWNVTGNLWVPADRASVEITLPAGATVQQSLLATGTFQHNAIVESNKDNVFKAHTTAPLQPHDPFVVVVAWPKGFVAPPGAQQRLFWLAQSDRALVWSFLGFVATAGYFLWAWRRLRRPPGVIIPTFHPPAGLTPAAIRYIVRKGRYDDKTFWSAAVSLATKGCLRITLEDSSYRLEPRGGDTSSLGAEETRLMQDIGSQALEFKSSNRGRIAQARDSVKASLQQLYKGRMFNPNLGSFFDKKERIYDLNLGWFVAGVVLAAIMIRQTYLNGKGNPGLGLSAGLVMLIPILVQYVGGWLDTATSRGLRVLPKLAKQIILIPPVLAAVGFFIFLPLMMWKDLGGGFTLVDFLSLGFVAAIFLLNLMFFYLLRAPTCEGRDLLDKIEGFRMYLATAEEDRLNIVNAPEQTPELFERYQAYALALDCAEAWSKKFKAVLAAADVRAPHWYTGLA